MENNPAGPLLSVLPPAPQAATAPQPAIKLPVTFETMDFSALDGLKPRSLGAWQFWLIIGIMPLTLLLGLIGVPIFIIVPLGFMAMFIAIILVVILQLAYKDPNHGIMNVFATTNGFAYSESMTAGGRPGTLFLHGHSQSLSRYLHGTYDALPFGLFNYQYSVGSGKHRRTYDALVMEFTLPRKLPHMIIDSLVEEGNGQGSTLPIDFDKSQRIQLEGDFHKYFDLYAPDTYGVTALTVIAPDAMDALLRHAALCDIEVIDDKVYFYWPQIANHRNHYQESFATAHEVLKKIGDKLKRSDIFAHPTQAQVHTQPGSQGVRLKKNKWGIISTIAFVILYLGAEIFKSATLGLYFTIPIGMIFVGSAIIAIYKAQKRTQLRKELVSRYAK